MRIGGSEGGLRNAVKDWARERLGQVMQSININAVVDQISLEKDNEKRLQLLRAVTDLFFVRSGQQSEIERELFDDVLSKLAGEAEKHIRAELSGRMASSAEAPKGLIKQLAHDEIEVASPVLSQSPILTDEDLVEIAEKTGQSHMLAISRRETLSETVTDVLVERGDTEVARSVARNEGAAFSETSYHSLVIRAAKDKELQTNLSERADLPRPLITEMLRTASEEVRQKLMERRRELDAELVDEALHAAQEKLEDEFGFASLDLTPAMRFVARLVQEDTLSEEVVRNLAEEKSFPETICALSAYAQIDIDNAKNFLINSSPEALLLVCKARNFAPATVAALLTVAPNKQLTDRKKMDFLYQYQNLPVAMAQRIVRFWKVRTNAEVAKG